MTNHKRRVRQSGPAGNDRYYAELEVEMKESNMMQREAEINMLYHTIKKMRLKDRMSWGQIAKWYEETYDLSKGAFETRREWITKAGLMLP